MLVLDDILTLPLVFMNLNVAPNLFVMIFESMNKFTRDSLIEEINSRIKENRMLYELKELGGEEYAKINEYLMEKLNLAKEVVSSEFEAKIRAAA